MIRQTNGSLYDYPKYYEISFGSDWKAEVDFLKECFRRHATRPVRRVFEPACGTGRLLSRLASAGYDVAGIDLNVKAIAYCNERLVRGGFAPSALLGDMSRFRLKRKVDAAMNMINSFRHLTTEEAALGHLKCVAQALARGGIYVLGLHLTPTGQGELYGEESWSARRGNLAVNTRLWTVHVDLRRRRERVAMAFDVYTPRRQFRLTDELEFRTYTARQMNGLLRQVPELEVVATYDFAYDIDDPIQIRSDTEDVVYVLRKL